MAVQNPGDEYSIDEILGNIKKFLENKGRPLIVDGYGIENWVTFLQNRINLKLGRTKSDR